MRAFANGGPASPTTAFVLESGPHRPVFPEPTRRRNPQRSNADMCRHFSCYEPVHMFTGLVELKGILSRRSRRGPGYRVAVDAAFGELSLGESISVSGACLTVVSSNATSFEADVSLETTLKTTLGALPLGSAVNLERALRVGDRMGGHWVSGHVDAVAEVQSVVSAGEAQRIRIAYPRELARFIAPKGSIALDGVSLTVNDVTDSALEVMVIPHTLSLTTLAELKPGSRINLEIDTLARYAVRFLEMSGASASEAGLKAALRGAGYEA